LLQWKHLTQLHSVVQRAASASSAQRLLQCLPKELRLLALQSTFWIDHVPTGKKIDAANYAAGSFGASDRNLARLPSTSSHPPQKTPSYRPPSIRWAGFIPSKSQLVRSSSRESCLDSAAADSCRNSCDTCLESPAAGSFQNTRETCLESAAAGCQRDTCETALGSAAAGSRISPGNVNESYLETAAAGCCRPAESFRSRCSCIG
jgi:hypothetical protein